MRRAASVSLPLAAVMIVGTTLLVTHHAAPAMTLTAKVTQGSVSNLATAKGVVSAASTADLNFQVGVSNIHEIDVKVGDHVKKGDKLAELDDGGLRRAILQAQQALAQQQAALNQLLGDYTPEGDRRAWEQAKNIAAAARRNIDLKQKQDAYAAHRQEHYVHLDEQAEDKAKNALRTAPGGTMGTTGTGCYRNGTPVPPVGLNSTVDPRLGTGSGSCSALLTAVQTADLNRYKDQTTLGMDYKTLDVDRGGLISTYRSARASALAAYNTWTIARRNRPTQIQAQQALVANALVNVASAQGHLDNSFIYAPLDGVVSAVNGTVGEYAQGGSELTPNTPLAPGGSAKVPTTGALAGQDQHNLTGGQGPNLGLQNVLPGGNTVIQLSDISAFSVVAAFPQNVASQINPGSAAKVGFDAFPGATTDGTVTAVSPIATPGGPDGAPMYYATVLLNKDQVPDHLKSGLTANVSVVTSSIENKALVIPSDAVTRDDGQSFVEVPGPAGPQKKPFTPGKVGDDNTQVLDGLHQGDTVMIPSTGPLPVPTDSRAPKVPTSRPITFQHTSPPATPATPPAPATAGAADQATAAPPAAPAAPVAPAATYPGDPGDVPDPSDATPPTAAGANGGGNSDGVNPFAAPAPASSSTPN
jgi:multidrug efflux pump subunit AcrA (membrane-fusion protein)